MLGIRGDSIKSAEHARGLEGTDGEYQRRILWSDDAAKNTKKPPTLGRG
jgi:hypothetical protein